MIYYAYQCDACKRHYMSTTLENKKCAYCRSSKGILKMQDEKPRVITEYVKRANAPFLYGGK